MNMWVNMVCDTSYRIGQLQFAQLPKQKSLSGQTKLKLHIKFRLIIF